MIDHLHDQATLNDIMYGLYMKQKIQAGLQATEDGNTIAHSHEQTSSKTERSVQIQWLQVAFDDLVAIRNYIAAETPFYADQFIDRIMAATEKLVDHPQIGRPVPMT